METEVNGWWQDESLTFKPAFVASK